VFEKIPERKTLARGISPSGRNDKSHCSLTNNSVRITYILLESNRTLKSLLVAVNLHFASFGTAIDRGETNNE